MSDALKPILLVLAGLVVILLYAATAVFELEIGVWAGLVLFPIVTLQIYIWTTRG